MECFSKYLIRVNQTVSDALKVLNTFGKDDALTLFVIEDNGSMVGTLTDGDIRRKLVDGLQLSASISTIMHRDFRYLKSNAISVKDIHSYKNEGIVLVPILNLERKAVDVINLKKQKSFLPIDAVLMAGGKGERLRPLTEKTPKPLIKVGEKCIIDYNIDRLLSYGLKHISVTINYLGEQIEEHFNEEREGVKITIVREPEYLGTIGSIKFIDSFYHDTVLVMNSDLFTNIDYEDFFLHFSQHDADMSVAAVPYVVKVPYGVFNLAGREIKGVTEKPTYSYYANAGIYLIKKKCLELIPENHFFNATDFMDKLIDTCHKVIRYPISGYWVDIGQHEELARAREMVKHLR